MVRVELLLLLLMMMWLGMGMGIQAGAAEAKPWSISDLRDLEFNLLQELSPLEKSPDFNRVLYVQNVDALIRIKRMLNIAQLFEVSIANMESANDRQFMRITLQEAVFFIKIDIREQRVNWTRFQTFAKTPEVQKYITDLLAVYDKIEAFNTADYEKSVAPRKAIPAP